MADTFDWTAGDRRRSPRVDLLAQLEGRVITLDEQVNVKQLSLGGMTIETTAPLSPRLQHDFRVSLAQAAITVQGSVGHSRVVVRGDTVTYIAGIEFLSPSAETLDTIRRIIDDVHAPTE